MVRRSDSGVDMINIADYCTVALGGEGLLLSKPTQRSNRSRQGSNGSDEYCEELVMLCMSLSGPPDVTQEGIVLEINTCHL